MLSIRAVTTLEEFETLANPWDALLQQAASSSIFLTWEWLYTWAKHYLRDHQLHILLVYKGGHELIGIAPFYVRRMTPYGLFPLREIRFLGTPRVSSCYLDFIVSRKQKKAVLQHIYQYLHEQVDSIWDTLTLPEIPADSSTIDLWNRFAQEAGKVIEIVDTTACPIIHLTNRLEDFLESISRNERYNLQRKQRRLTNAGSVAYERICSVQEVGPAFDIFSRLLQTRWGSNNGASTFPNPRFLSFHQEITRRFSERGWVRIDFLRLNGQVVAGIHGYSYNARYFFYLPAFNPAIIPQASPGILLLFQCIREAIKEGHHEFDLLRGQADYKIAWANSFRRSLTMRHYNRHVRNTAVKLFETGKAIAKVLAR
jgi:CelD/BcsL family acetyltransferase involved in cellulose biosynthesis